MSPVTAEQVRAFLKRYLANALAAKGLSGEDLADGFDFLTEGIIDSLGILELIAALERDLDVVVDFEEISPEDLTIVGPFCRFVAERGRGVAGGR